MQDWSPLRGSFRLASTFLTTCTSSVTAVSTERQTLYQQARSTVQGATFSLRKRVRALRRMAMFLLLVGCVLSLLGAVGIADALFQARSGAHLLETESMVVFLVGLMTMAIGNVIWRRMRPRSTLRMLTRYLR